MNKANIIIRKPNFNDINHIENFFNIVLSDTFSQKRITIETQRS